MAKTKKRKKASPQKRLLWAAWEFVLAYYDDASNSETHEEKMLRAIRRILREVRRG